MNTITIREALHAASSFLSKRNLEPPVAEWLLRHYLNVDRTHLFLALDEPLKDELWQKIQSDLQRHATGVPIQHIIGYDYFFGRRFIVNEHVLIPRPETEELVVAVMKKKKALFGDEKVKVADIGTGTGAVAITLALEMGGDIIATDISKEALSVAKKNATSLSADVTFYEGDLFEPLLREGEKVDIVVSNPPYIPLTEKDELAKHVRDFEPHLALFGGVDGLEIYRRLIQDLPQVIKQKAIIAFEVGAGQSKAVANMLEIAFPKEKAEIIYDINGKDRIVIMEVGAN